MAYDDADLPESGEEAEETRVHEDDELREMFSRWDRDIMDNQAQWATEARLCYDMVAGDQWDKDAIEQLKLQEIAPITWNRVQPLVDAVSGAQIQNRHEVKFFPREIGDAGVSEVLTAAAQWCADEGDFDDEETDAFFDTLVCGMGWTETRMDYEVDPDGQIMKDRVDPLEMRYDPSASKRNVADKRYLRRKRPFSKEQFKDRFPEWADEITASDESEEPNYSVENPGDDYPGQDNPDKSEKAKNDIFVKEYQWYEVEKYQRVFDTQTREDVTIPQEDFENLQTQMAALGMPMRLDAVTAKRRVYYRAFCADDKILDYEKLHCDGFTYHAITGKRDRNKGTWYGLVRAMVDPQRWANKWMTQILVIINKNAKGGIMAEVDAFEDADEAEENFAKPDSITWLQTGAVAQGKVQPKPQPPYPQGLDRMIQMAISSIRDVTGINQELLGMVDRDQPGILEAQRKEAGYAMLSMFFDSLRRYRKMSGRLLLEYIQKYISDGRLIRVIGKEGGAKYVPLVRQEGVSQYDVVVDEAPTGPNQKDKVWAMFVQIMPMLMRQPVPPSIWAEMVRWSPLPESVSQNIMQQIMQAAQPNPQAQQAQAEAAQMQKAMFQANIQKTQAEAMQKQADAQSTMARVPLEQANLQLDAQKIAVEQQKTQGETMKVQADAQMAQMDAGKRAAEIDLLRQKTSLTAAQEANQVLETAISQLYAIQNAISGQTDIRINT